MWAGSSAGGVLTHVELFVCQPTVAAHDQPAMPTPGWPAAAQFLKLDSPAGTVPCTAWQAATEFDIHASVHVCVGDKASPDVAVIEQLQLVATTCQPTWSVLLCSQGAQHAVTLCRRWRPSAPM